MRVKHENFPYPIRTVFGVWNMEIHFLLDKIYGTVLYAIICYQLSTVV